MAKKVVEITSYDPVFNGRNRVPKTYVDKKTGEVVKIQWKTKYGGFVIL